MFSDWGRWPFLGLLGCFLLALIELALCITLLSTVPGGQVRYNIRAPLSKLDRIYRDCLVQARNPRTCIPPPDTYVVPRTSIERMAPYGS